MDLPLAMSPAEKCAIVLLLTAVAAPLAGLVFRRVAGGWDSIGGGPLAIEAEATRLLGAPAQPGVAGGDDFIGSR